MDKQARMKELIEVLNKASRAYYQEDREVFSNKEYDELYDELQALEKETGIVMSQSPTQNVGYEVLSELEKETNCPGRKRTAGGKGHCFYLPDGSRE